MSGLGTQYVAPEGYGLLAKDRVYHLLHNDSRALTVSLVYFAARPTSTARREKPISELSSRFEPLAILLRVERSSFEDGVQSDKVIVVPTQATLPFWLDGLIETNLEFSDERRKTCKKTHRERIDEKLAHIQPMVDQYKEVLASDDPEGLLNRQARACTPRVNETRFRLWFFAYLAFGKKRFALHYPTQHIGRWQRLDSDTKRGRPNKSKGKGYGRNASADMIRTILKSYRRLRRLGAAPRWIYRRALVQDFGCRTRRSGERGFCGFFHPEGKPFPTKSIYWHYVEKEFGKDKVRETRIGGVKERSKVTPYRGSFSSDVLNLMERVEDDAYVMKEAPRGLLDGSVLKPIRVARIRDVRSGLDTGIGFAFGSETSAAYRMARFCQAIPKVKFGSLFGMVFSADQWPSQGSSARDVQDRGPGSTPGAFSQDPEFEPVIKTLPPSYAGQSHAVIESTHPRALSNDEAPSFILSDKNVVLLVRQEIERLLVRNDSTDVGERIPDDLLEMVDRHTPVCLWSALDRLGRNDAVPMSFDEAVRAFLTKVPAIADRHGVRLFDRVFGSRALDASGFRERLSGRQTMPVAVYVLDACVRHIWMEVQGRIVELDMQVPVRVADDELYISLEDLRERAEFMRDQRRSLEEHRDATAAQREIDFKAATGKDLDSGIRVAGRPKVNTELALREASEAKHIMTGRKRA
jgi:hypothetical protein